MKTIFTRWFLLRTNAGILSVVLTIGIVIGLLMTSLITLAYYYRSSYQSYTITDRLANNAQSGIAYLLATESPADSSVLDLYGEGIDSVRLLRKPWGAFEVLAAVAFTHADLASAIVMKGFRPGETGMSALYLADENKPLSLSGNSIVDGDCFLPKSGVKTALMDGKGFSGNKLVTGNILESSSMLPPLAPELIARCKHDPDQLVPSVYKYRVLNDLPDSLTHSFLLPTLLYRTQGDLYITQRLSGNMIITSEGTVTFSPESKAEDILVFAKQIIFEENFSGKLQAFASELIEVEDNCKLSYPSVLITHPSQDQSRIVVGRNAQIEGIVVSSGMGSAFNRLTSFEDGSKLYGHLYSDGLLQLKGAIIGHVTCRKFTLTTPSSVYENVLQDVEISSRKLPEDYLGAPLWWKSETKGIIKWLE